jgi:hypothetical protein
MSERPEILNEMEFARLLESQTPEKKPDFLAWRLYYLQKDIADIKQNCIICTPDKKQQALNYTGLAGLIAGLSAILWKIYDIMKG